MPAEGLTSFFNKWPDPARVGELVYMCLHGAIATTQGCRLQVCLSKRSFFWRGWLWSCRLVAPQGAETHAGLWLDSVILKVFSNLNESMILYVCIYVYTYAYVEAIHVCICVCPQVPTCTRVYSLYMREREGIHMNSMCTHTNTHIYIFIYKIIARMGASPV